MQGYILFTSPAIFLMTAEFYDMLSNYKIYHPYTWVYNLILTLLILLPIRYSIERTKPFENYERRPQWVTDLKNIEKQKIKNGVLFNYDKPIEAMFYTSLLVYPYIPEKETIIELQRKGYHIYMNDNGNIPMYILTTKNLVILKLIN